MPKGLTDRDNYENIGDAIREKTGGEYTEYKPSQMAAAIRAISQRVTFVDADATVDGTVGTPSVTVTSEGDAEERTLHFAFSGIKGETGGTGATGPQGPKGDKGDKGDTYELTSADKAEIKQTVEQELASSVTAANNAATRANAAATNADATADGVESRVQQMADDAAESAASQVEDRVEAAIDAMGDISELAVPEMGADVRGGAKLEAHGGLALRDGALGIGSLVQESDGYARGGLAEVTAKGHAEQVSTTGKNLLDSSFCADRTQADVTSQRNTADGSIRLTGTEANRYRWWNSSDMLNITLPAGTYTLSPSYVVMSLDGSTSNVKRGTFTISEATTFVNVAFDINNLALPTTCYPQLELGSTATEYEPYTGGAPSPSPDYPQEIQVVRGRNLFNKAAIYKRNHLIASDGSETENNGIDIYESIPIDSTKSYYIRCRRGSNNTSDAIRVGYYSDTTFLSREIAFNKKLNIPDNATSIRLCYSSVSGSSGEILDVQLTEGSTPQPYVPYGYVGMEARDPDTDELISCTALPLPQRGWVAGLPDGTADSLRLDGAGKCEWTLEDGKYTVTGSESINSATQNGSYRRILLTVLNPESTGYTYDNNNGYCTHAPYLHRATMGAPNVYTQGTSLHLNAEGTNSASILEKYVGATVLYPLATPVTEDCGYVEDWPTDIPDSATVSIPELDAVNIKYFIGSAVTELARQWYEKARSEYEDRIASLESAVADLVTGA